MSGQRAKRLGIRQRKAAELRAQGLSLRQIAARLRVSHMTASRDLAAWDAAHPSHNGAGNVTADVRLGDFRTVLADLAPGSAAALITDPPYPAQFLPLWSDLAEHAAKWLRPGGILAAMSGQLWLPEVIARLGRHLDYWWVISYAAPGDAVPVWPRRARSQWKPVLVYRNGDGTGPPWFGDVARSGPGRGDKRLHDWAQTEDGMADLVGVLTVPGDLIVDPMCGTARPARRRSRSAAGSPERRSARSADVATLAPWPWDACLVPGHTHLPWSYVFKPATGPAR